MSGQTRVGSVRRREGCGEEGAELGSALAGERAGSPVAAGRLLVDPFPGEAPSYLVS